MAFADPQTLKFGTTDVSLPRTGFGQGNGEFTSGDNTKNLSVLVTTGKRHRRSVRLKTSDIVQNPLVSNQSMPVTSSYTLTSDVPLNGITTAEQAVALKAFSDWLAVPANQARFLGNEV